MQVKIDTRPLPIVILSRWWRFPVFALLNFSLYYFYHQPPPEGLSVAGFRVLIVFLACIFLWMTQLLPLPVTGLFALIAPSLLGVISLKDAFSFFGSGRGFLHPRRLHPRRSPVQVRLVHAHGAASAEEWRRNRPEGSFFR